MSTESDIRTWRKAVVERIGILQHELEIASGGQARLLPVTKAFGPEAVRAVREAGLTAVGENYAQELMSKRQAVDDPKMDWHMIGRLQRNKVRRLAGLVSLWQTVDRPELVDEIARHEPGARVLVQVDVLGRSEQGGCPPRAVEKLVIRGHEAGLEVAGLMGMGVDDDRKGTEQAFSAIAQLADQLGLAERSMGMTQDRELAVAHGSTLVRVGRALFGDRPTSRWR